jgi:hypothetical protein
LIPYTGKTIALYAESGRGKTTQAGEYAKYVRKTRGKNAVLYTSDLGGYDSLGPLVRKGVVTPVEFRPDVDNAWVWIDDGVEGRLNGKPLDETYGLAIFDSGTSMAEALLTACSHSDFQIGQQRTQKFSVTRGDRNLTVAINNEAHYGVVQGFLLDAIWKSTWLTRRGIDVIWTFSVHRGEEQDRTPILGPKLAGKALTASIPKWFKFCFRLDTEPVEGNLPQHVLYTTIQSEMAGLGQSFGNIRCPLGVTPPPAVIRPASLVVAIQELERCQKEADDLLESELDDL